MKLLLFEMRPEKGSWGPSRLKGLCSKLTLLATTRPQITTQQTDKLYFRNIYGSSYSQRVGDEAEVLVAEKDERIAAVRQRLLPMPVLRLLIVLGA